jgi:hypothetical protein
MTRVLIIGRSPSVIVEVVEILRGKGFDADATNQFDSALADYDTANLDVVVFGGAVPPNTKQHLREEISRVNDHVTFVQGLVGIAGVIVAQVEGIASAEDDDIDYQPTPRTVQLTLRQPARVVVEAWWATSFTPPEPTSTSLVVVDAKFEAGEHTVSLPDDVPTVASYVTVSAGAVVRAFAVGPLPEALAGLVAGSLPPVRAVATHG